MTPFSGFPSRFQLLLLVQRHFAPNRGPANTLLVAVARRYISRNSALGTFSGGTEWSEPVGELLSDQRPVGFERVFDSSFCALTKIAVGPVADRKSVV